MVEVRNTVVKLAELNRRTMNKKYIAIIFVFPLLLVSMFIGKVEADAPAPIVKTEWSVQEVKDLVDYYADKHKLSRQVLHKVIACESQYNEHAVNWKDSHRLSKGSHGVAQFSRETFIGFAKQMDRQDYDNPYNPNQALDVASWAIKNGYGNQWTCFRK